MLKIFTVPPRLDQPENIYSENAKTMLGQIRKVMDDEGQLEVMRDTSFHVGTVEGHRQIIKANSTILSLRSPYFRELCFGTLLSDMKTKIICVEVEIFEKVLRFCYGTADCLLIADCDEAWSLRRAAEIFQMKDLLQLCEDFLLDHLDFKSALQTFKVARLHEANNMRLACLKVMRNRYKFILGSEKIKILGIGDMIDLVSFFRELAIPGLVLNGLDAWGSSLEGGKEQFKKIFRAQIFPLIDWKSLENEAMTRLVGSGWMTRDQEHIAMAEILSGPGPAPEEPQLPAEASLTVKFVCTKTTHLFMRTCSCQKAQKSFRQIVLTMVSNSTQLTATNDRDSEDLFDLERGMRFLRRGIVVEKGSVTCSTIPEEDISLEIIAPVEGAAVALEVNDLRAAAVSISGSQFIVLEFSSGKFEVGGNKGEGELSIRAVLSPIMMADLESGVLPRRSQLTTSTKSSRGTAGEDYKLRVVGWKSVLKVIAQQTHLG